MEEKRTPGQIHMETVVYMELFEWLLEAGSTVDPKTGLLHIQTDFDSKEYLDAVEDFLHILRIEGYELTPSLKKAIETIGYNSAIVPSLSFEVGGLEKFGYKYMVIIYHESVEDSPTVFLTNIDNLGDVLSYFD